jgi:hypothetical protein
MSEYGIKHLIGRIVLQVATLDSSSKLSVELADALKNGDLQRFDELRKEYNRLKTFRKALETKYPTTKNTG